MTMIAGWYSGQDSGGYPLRPIQATCVFRGGPHEGEQRMLVPTDVVELDRGTYAWGELKDMRAYGAVEPVWRHFYDVVDGQPALTGSSDL